MAKRKCRDTAKESGNVFFSIGFDLFVKRSSDQKPTQEIES